MRSPSSTQASQTPFRKQLKDQAKRKRDAQRLDAIQGITHAAGTRSNGSNSKKWRLTVGLEIHAQLNTERKLFSDAMTSEDDTPNSNIAVFDLAFPGYQPEFQKPTILPALRAALGLNCEIRQKSQFDRKHYHYQDQPAGYQITQYYSPFAVSGNVAVYDYDGIALEDGKVVNVAIKQIQMEQDTAKSNLQPPSTTLLDFNRVGHPLIEIITHPQIHHPQTASACVRKIQSILQVVNAVTTGMELGGLRADVNVSISPDGSEALGQRTEIKNLSSFKAVEDAIIAERDRQIAVLESGGSIEGETRGWTLGSTETKKLRGKEGEVDYRYMPDPDIAPLIIGRDLIDHSEKTLPKLPEEIIADLVSICELTIKDAKTLITLDNGERLDYFDTVRTLWMLENNGSKSTTRFHKIVGNWVLHVLGGLLSATNIPFSPTIVPPKSMVSILQNLNEGKITGDTAKKLLTMVFGGDERDVNAIIEQDDLRLQRLSREEYIMMAKALLEKDPKIVEQIQKAKQLGKLKFFVGQMMRQGSGKVEAQKAEAVLKELLGLD
ncbi:MAG: hypothetical protein ASARMPRED_007634 [Alectoria sarmentosa]|nr:MAG: hypothetical protein ASARMPRED_007634 [Alectoria sarmentosa]